MKDGVIIIHKPTGMGCTEVSRSLREGLTMVEPRLVFIEADCYEVRSVTHMKSMELRRLPDLPQVELEQMPKPNQKWYHQFDKKRRF